ncbi:exodeoxyribonuclease V subunit gamma [Solicola sp. PLA-1-18]|uniref:exodeoxyribonuclease V subunit gamma n=1 Tax=Solicola sp. PLA-1-18 TaxID=3380532 RepID=UPI003B81801B
MLRIHRAERADALVRGLGELLTTPPDDPFTADVVAVPSRGVERWISQALSVSLGAQRGRADGVCANVVFPSPTRLVADVVASVGGFARDDDPWSPRRLTWPLLEVIGLSLHEPWCLTLRRHLLDADGVDQGRRVQVALHLAGLFSSYASQRPRLLLDWASGDDTDGAGAPLADDLRWQAELWRRLRAEIGEPSPAERVDDVCARLRVDATLVDLPARLSLFGLTRLTADELQVLDALAAHRDVHLWLPHPSHASWARLAGTTAPALARRVHDTSADLADHPLLRSLGREAREMQLVVGAHVTPADDVHLDLDHDAPGLLGALQRDVHLDRVPDGSHVLDLADRSVQVHACHGRQRQVEVLRETVLGLLEDDPTLEPRDVLVMCPDIEAYAPLLSAAFGLADTATDEVHPGHRLTVRLADRSLRQTNPVLAVVARVLDLADGRMTASDLLDLAAAAPVRSRFRLDDEDLERVGDWVRRSGVRWGLDAEGRTPFGLGGVPQNTWQTGLDRIMVGVTMDEDELRTVGLALPLDDLDSNEIDLAGRLAELVDRVGHAVRSLHREQTPAQWLDALVAVVDDLTHAPPRDDWQTAQARRQLADSLVAPDGGSAPVRLRLADVRALLARGLEGRPTRANFRTGHLTICTMVPMRSVPHRVVCLLGLDDGVFPRGTRVDGDDVLGRSPVVGERDPRAEDRQLFLDAVLAARERLVVLHTGADERTGALRPPAVPVGELLDVLDLTATAPSGRVRDHVVVRHPLQPFDARNFTDGALGHPGPFSFDRASFTGSDALRHDRPPVPGFLPGPLPVGEPGDVALDDLVRFLEHPVRQFLRGRLGLTLLAEEDEPDDALPVEIDSLQQWSVGDRLLAAGLAGTPDSAAVTAEWLRGTLPPGALGRELVAPIQQDAARLVADTTGLRAGEPRAVDLGLVLPDGTRLDGTVPRVHGSQVVRVEYSRLGPKHRLRAWVQLLALAAAEPGTPWTAATVGRGRGGSSMARLVAPPEDVARRLLWSLVRLFREGQAGPVPFSPKTSALYAEKRERGTNPHLSVEAARSQWRKTYDRREIGDFDDAFHRLVWGDAQIEALLVEPPDPSDADWPDEPHRFGQVARRVWSPLLAVETRHDR